MLRSLYTGISGMRSMQTMMDVTGNNIANVNTTGYKTANTVFEDTLSQTLGNAAAPQNAKGGQNPAQVGLGVRVAGISTNFAQGATQSTGRNSDMLIDGDGFFVVNNNGATNYTRNGSFSTDANGTLVSSSGGKIQGWAAVNGTTNTASNPENVIIPKTQMIPAYATRNVTFSGALDNTIAMTGTTDPTSGVTTYAPAAGTTQTFPYKIVDKNGVDVPVKVTVQPASSAQNGLVSGWTVTVTQLQGGVDAKLAQVTFNASGTMAAGVDNPATATVNPADKTVKLDGLKSADGTTAFDPMPLFDFHKISIANLADTSLSTVGVSSQDGYGAGTLTSWKVGPDGAITGSFDNGRSMELGKIAVATFDNPAGLDKQGGSMYMATSNSGLANVGPAGDGARGAIVSGALEMSNVDLAAEFTNLIVAQRGFQASSRVITTSDSMLEELVNLKR